MSGRFIDLRRASHVLALARTLSFTRAASELGITQSALSRSIQQLERACGMALFDRGGSHVQLTAMGRLLHEQAADLLQKGAEIDETIQQMAKGRQGRVAFGMARTAAVSLLPQMLAAELQSNPDLQSQVVVRSFEDLLLLLQHGEIEFFVGADQRIATQMPVEATELALFPLAQLVRFDHPLLAYDDPVPYTDYPWMIASNTTSRASSKSLRWHHLRPMPQIVLEDLSCAAQLTQTTDVIWVTSAFSALTELREGRLQELAFPNDAPGETYRPYELKLYKVPGRTLSPVAERLATSLRDLAQSMAAQVTAIRA